jgi:hypothetical protein
MPPAIHSKLPKPGNQSTVDHSLVEKNIPLRHRTRSNRNDKGKKGSEPPIYLSCLSF